MKLSLIRARILRALLDQPRYGAELTDRMGTPSGTLQPLLGKFEAEGLVSSHWEYRDPDGARYQSGRRYYRLTPNGIAYARTELAKLADELRPPEMNREEAPVG